MSKSKAAPSPASLKTWIRKVDVEVFSTDGKVIFCECQNRVQLITLYKVKTGTPNDGPSWYPPKDTLVICQCHFRAKKLFQLKQHLRTSKHIRNTEERATTLSDVQSRNKTLEGALNELKASPKAESSAPCCANCTCSLEEESTEIWTELSFAQDREDSELEAEKPVKILEALEMIFDFKFHPDEADDAVHERLILCSKCGKHLADLYKLFCGFKELCHEYSYIKGRIRFPSDSKLFDKTPQSPQIMRPHWSDWRDSSLKIKERLRLTRMRAQKRRLKLKSQLQPKSSVVKDEPEEPEEASSTRRKPSQRSSRNIDEFSYAQDNFDDSDGEDRFDDPLETPANLCETEMELVVPKRGRGRPRLDDTRPRKAPKPKKPRGKRDHICQLCGKVAKSNWNLQLHIQGVHEGLRRYQCATCKKYYSNKSFLLNHVRVTHNREANQFICSEPGCGKSFAYPAGLRVHRTIHTGEYKFSCDVCHKRFRRGCDLKMHQSTHTSEKPFVCEHCGCCFKTRLNLKKHSVIHDEKGRFHGKSPPTCQICNKTFLATWNLQLHIRTVHEKLTPFKCPLCVKAFSSGSNLKVHLQGFHKCARDDNNKIILPPLFSVHQDEPSDGDTVIMNTQIPVAFKYHSSNRPEILPIPLPPEQDQSEDLRLAAEVADQPNKTGGNGNDEEVWSNRSYSNVVTSYL